MKHVFPCAKMHKLVKAALDRKVCKAGQLDHVVLACHSSTATITILSCDDVINTSSKQLITKHSNNWVLSSIANFIF